MYRRLMIVVATAFALGLPLLSLGAGAACVKGVASDDTLRIRSGPNSAYSEVSRIPHNACNVRIMGKCQGGWCPVAYANATGWASGAYLQDEPEPPPASAPPTVQPTETTGLCVHGIPQGGALQVRAGPGPDFVPLYGFRPGTCGIRIAGGCRGAYCPVQYKEFKGWADRRQLRQK